jgi:hypothetical protein
LRRYNELIENRIKPDMQAAYQEIAQAGGDMDSVSPFKFHVLNMLNARYFILPTKEGEMPLENPYALGNAWFVKNVKYVANADEELDALKTENPHITAIVDNRFKTALHDADALQSAEEGQIELTAYEPNSLTYKSHNASDGVAVFSEIYYPDGWQVSIDGNPVEMARANYVLRSLYVPAGDHTIQMDFDPKSLHVTEGIAYCALALMLVFCIFALWYVKDIITAKKTSV